MMFFYICFLLLLAATTKPSAARAAAAPISCEDAFELVYIVDSSSIFNSDEYDDLRDVLVGIKNNLQDPVTVAAISFSQVAKREFDFLELSAADSPISNIQLHPSQNESSAEDTFALADALNGTEGVQKIYAFFIHTGVAEKTDFLAEAVQAKSNGVKILAVAFGDSIDEPLLTGLVSDAANSNYFTFPAPGDLLNSTADVQAISQKMCDLAGASDNTTSDQQLNGNNDNTADAETATDAPENNQVATNPSIESNPESNVVVSSSGNSGSSGSSGSEFDITITVSNFTFGPEEETPLHVRRNFTILPNREDPNDTRVEVEEDVYDVDDVLDWKKWVFTDDGKEGGEDEDKDIADRVFSMGKDILIEKDILVNDDRLNSTENVVASRLLIIALLLLELMFYYA